METRGHTFLITSGGTGLGAAVARNLASRGASAISGGLYGVVNCSGVASAEKVLGKEGPHSLDSFTKVIQVNLIRSFNAIRLAAAA